jgi:hypothetical protein
MNTTNECFIERKAIHQFRKTTHFISRQSERQISDQTLKECLRRIENQKGKVTYVVSRKLLKRIGVNSQIELFIIIDQDKLITAFYADFQEFILNAPKKYCIIIINDLD